MSSDIHSDGTVELIQRWRPGGAQGNADSVFHDGGSYVFAIRMSTEEWQFVVVVASVDPEFGTTFDTVDGYPFGWEWSEVEWWVPCSELDLPYVPL